MLQTGHVRVFMVPLRYTEVQLMQLKTVETVIVP